MNQETSRLAGPLRVFAIILVGLAILPCTSFGAGKIVASFDDWSLSDSGFGSPNDPGVYVQHIAAWFTGGGSGKFIGYDRAGDFHLTGTGLKTALEAAGHTYVASDDLLLSYSELLKYDGVFIGAWPLGHHDRNIWALTVYVAMGGNVYIYGGTNCYGSIEADAQILNKFLNQFGLGFAASVDGVKGNVPISGSHQILQDVGYLYGDNGTEVLDLELEKSQNEVIASYDGEGIIAVSDGLDPTAIKNDSLPPRVESIRAFPNPGDRLIHLMVESAKPGTTRIEIYDLQGRSVRTLEASTLGAGMETDVTWDGRDKHGVRAAAGIYFAKFGANPTTVTKITVLH